MKIKCILLSICFCLSPSPEYFSIDDSKKHDFFIFDSDVEWKNKNWIMRVCFPPVASPRGCLPERHHHQHRLLVVRSIDCSMRMNEWDNGTREKHLKPLFPCFLLYFFDSQLVFLIFSFLIFVMGLFTAVMRSSRDRRLMSLDGGENGRSINNNNTHFNNTATSSSRQGSGNFVTRSWARISGRRKKQRPPPIEEGVEPLEEPLPSTSSNQQIPWKLANHEDKPK